jgi:DNA-binding IclR family transcriptional regulator
MSASAEANRYCVSALVRGIRILGLFEDHAMEISGAAVARELQLPRATTFRLMRTLERLGCLERAEGGAYRIGPAVPGRGVGSFAPHELTRVARSAVERLRDRTAFPARLVVRDGRDAVVALHAAAPGSSAASVSVGARCPAYADVLGRLILCEATDAELVALYPELELPHVGIGSPPTLAELKQVLHEDLARGYTVGDAFLEQRVAGIAAPVRAPDGEFVAVVGLAVDQSALKQWVFRDWLVKEVLAAAAEIADGLSRRRGPGRSAGAAGTAPYAEAGGRLMHSALP